MFGTNSFEIMAQVAHMHQQEILHEAEELQRIRESGYREPPFLKVAAWQFGSLLISLGERLGADACTVQPARSLTYRRI